MGSKTAWRDIEVAEKQCRFNIYWFSVDKCVSMCNEVVVTMERE